MHVYVYLSMYTGLSAIFFYLTWKGNGSADIDEIWQVGKVK